MDTNVLKTFVAVCEYSGFSAAAEKLGEYALEVGVYLLEAFSKSCFHSLSQLVDKLFQLTLGAVYVGKLTRHELVSFGNFLIFLDG